MGMKPLGMAQDKPLPQKDPLEGTQEIQMGDVDRPPFFNENQTQFTHGSTPLLLLCLPRIRWVRQSGVGMD